MLKNNIDLNYTASDHIQHKHRAIAITKPFFNLTGAYTCSVGTYESEDKRTKRLQIIKPETDFQLKVDETTDGSGDISVLCSARNIYPEPKLMIR